MARQSSARHGAAFIFKSSWRRKVRLSQVWHGLAFISKNFGSALQGTVRSGGVRHGAARLLLSNKLGKVRFG
jgi:hypothetical protein